MGPVMSNEEHFSSSIKGISLPKLAEDGSKWVLYQEQLENTVTATKGLRCHLHGMAHKLEPLELKTDQKWYTKGGTTPLTNKHVDAYEETIKVYEQQEAQVCEFIYGTIDTSTFI